MRESEKETAQLRNFVMKFQMEKRVDRKEEACMQHSHLGPDLRVLCLFAESEKHSSGRGSANFVAPSAFTVKITSSVAKCSGGDHVDERSLPPTHAVSHNHRLLRSTPSSNEEKQHRPENMCML